MKKSNIAKRVSAFLLCISMLFSLVFAAEPVVNANKREVKIDGITVYVQMQDGSACTWPLSELEEFLSGTPISNGDLVTIGDISVARPQNSESISPRWYDTYENTLVNVLGRGTETSEMLFSVARGETLTLTKSYTVGFSLKVIGSAPFNLESIKAEGTVETSYTYSESHSYEGPGDSTPYNSRAFYVRHYYADEEWRQDKYGYNTQLLDTCYTIVRRPEKSISFSVDSYESL